MVSSRIPNPFDETNNMASTEPSQDLTQELQKLVDANHILHRHNILDGFGHVSLRNLENRETFFLARVPAALIHRLRSFGNIKSKTASPSRKESAFLPTQNIS